MDFIFAPTHKEIEFKSKFPFKLSDLTPYFINHLSNMYLAKHSYNR